VTLSPCTLTRPLRLTRPNPQSAWGIPRATDSARHFRQGADAMPRTDDAEGRTPAHTGGSARFLPSGRKLGHPSLPRQQGVIS